MFRKMKTQYREMAEYDIEKVVPCILNIITTKKMVSGELKLHTSVFIRCGTVKIHIV